MQPVAVAGKTGSVGVAAGKAMAAASKARIDASTFRLATHRSSPSVARSDGLKALLSPEPR